MIADRLSSRKLEVVIWEVMEEVDPHNNNKNNHRLQ